MGTGGGRGEALEGVRLGVVRSSHGDYAWYGSDVVGGLLVETYAD
jgi:hypothetical protein